MEFKASPRKYRERIFWNLVEGGFTTLIFVCLFLSGLSSGSVSWIVEIIFIFLAIGVAFLTWNRLKWYRVYITRIEFLENKNMVNFLDRDKPKESAEFLLADTKLTFSTKGQGGANKFLNISDNTKTITQISTGNWTAKVFAQILIKFKDLKSEKLTYDEQDWLKRLDK